MFSYTSKSGVLLHRYAIVMVFFIIFGTLLLQNPHVGLGAESEPTLTIETCQIAPGESGDVTITARNIPYPGLAGYKISVQYDPNKLEPPVLVKTAFDAFSMQTSNKDTPGIISLVAAQPNGVKGDFTVARLSFKAKSTVSGSTDLNLKVDQLVLADLKNLQIQAVNGQVTFSANLEQAFPKQDSLKMIIDSLPEVFPNQAYSYTLSAQNGKPPYTWSASGLPEGLTLNSQTGEISGVPTMNAESNIVQISLSDSSASNQPVTATFPMEVVKPDPPSPANENTSGSASNVTPSSGTVTTGGVPAQTVSPQTSVVFKTSRLSGITAPQTAIQIAEQTGWKGTAVLASSAAYGLVDALTAGPLSTYLKAPILLTDSANKLNNDTKAELAKLEVKTVYVTSGTGVISQAILNELASMGIKVVTLGGADRFETSVNIANKMVELGAPITQVAVAYGWKNQDALSIASIASAQNAPILLTEKDKIPASVKSFLSSYKRIKAAYVIGGTGVISDSVKDQLPSPTRLFGKTAYDTNAQVIRHFDSDINYNHVFLANGETAIDALAGVPLAAKTKAAIILTNQETPDIAPFIKSKMTTDSVITALGGTAVVPTRAVDGIVGK